MDECKPLDDGYGGVCDVHQNTTVGASGGAAPCGTAHYGRA